MQTNAPKYTFFTIETSSCFKHLLDAPIHIWRINGAISGKLKEKNELRIKAVICLVLIPVNFV